MGENVKHTPAMSRELMGLIVDEVFDGAIEDTRVIEEIYAVIKRHDGTPDLLEALKRIQRLSDRCGALPDTEGLRRAYRDIDVAARVAIAKAEGRP